MILTLSWWWINFAPTFPAVHPCLLRDDDKSDGIKLSSGLTEAQQQFYVQHHRQDVWFNHYLDKGCQGIVSANTLSSSVGLLASFGAQFAAGGVCRVKGRG
jgi:hypothetical protein